MHLNFDASITRWGYRQAEVLDRVFSATFDRNDEWGQLRCELAERCGGHPDNHETYEVMMQSGKALYIGFSDWFVYVGLDIRIS